MVVLSGSICTRGGKVLLSRQFRDISKDKIVSLLANFPSLISTSSSQHTTVEDENVRYVYQPLEEFYIVLLTNKQSNILQDIDTLHLFSSTVSNMLRSIDEREVFDNAFEILSAFDEIVNLGYKENLTLSQVQNFLEMDSHEEKIQEIIERNKEMEATEERKRRAKEIQRKELARRNLEQTLPSSYNNYDEASYSQPTPTYQTPSVQESVPSYLAKPNVARSGGLQLGKKPARPTAEANQPLLAQSQPVFQHQAPAQPQSRSATSSPAPSAPKLPNNGILISITEKIVASLTRDGTVLSSEVSGALQLRINDSELASCKLLLNVDKSNPAIKFKTHPNVDRNLFNQQGVIGLKDKSKSFPANDQNVGVLRWSGKSDDSSLLPVIITVWVNQNDNGTADVTIEYELTPLYLENSLTNQELNDVKILIPVQSSDISVNDDSGNVTWDLEDFGVVFTLASISHDDPQGSFEFTVPTVDEDSLFPMELQFNITDSKITESDKCFGGLKVSDVVSTKPDTEDSLPFDLYSTLVSEGYLIN